MSSEFRPTQRYTILRRVGAGGMGVVYEALDTERNARVALKTLRAADARSLLRFKAEFRSLADIAHKNLVSLYDLVADKDTWFFTMELVGGTDFLSWVRPGVVSDTISEATGDSIAQHLADTVQAASDPKGSVLGAASPGRLDEARLRSALLQLALGLSALHSAETVHRDLKPTNVLVTPAGRVVIVDFGLATDAVGGPHSVEALAGTIAYMAPEQAASERVGPAADWYAVGVMLYEALTGVLPYQGSAYEVLANKQQRAPAPPERLDPTAPEDLCDLCVRLLSLDPSARPTDAEVLTRLGAARPRSHAIATPGGAFVGRERELNALLRAYEDVRRGAGVTVYVHGESGVGKTALVRRFMTRLAAHDSDTMILPGRCYERESVPFKAVDGVVDALARQLRRMPKGDAAAVMPLHASVLADAFPVLESYVPPNAPRPGQLEPAQQRARVLGALRETFQRLASRTCVVMLIDDLQWADADSLVLLREIMRPPDAPPLLLIATVRTAGTLGTHAMPASRLNVGSSMMPGDVRVIGVERLPPEDARTLVENLYKRANSSGDLPRARAIAIAEEAAGHPLFIDELVRHAMTDGAPASGLLLEDALWSRISALDPGARSLVEVACLAGTPLEHRVAARAAEIADRDDYERVVGVLRSGHLLRTTKARGEPAVEPYHDRVRQALLLHLAGSHREPARIHARIAEALEHSGTSDFELLAQQTRAAGDRRKTALYAERAGEHAAKVLAFERAARLFQEALDAGDTPPADVRRLHSRIGDVLVAAGRGADAALAYQKAASALDDEDAIDLRMRAGTQLLVSGRVDDGLAIITELLPRLDLPLPATTGRATLLLQRTRLRLRGYSFKPRPPSAQVAHELRRIDACYSLAMGLGLVDPARAMEFQSRGLLLALDAADPLRVARAMTLEIGFVATTGHASRQRWTTILAQTRRILEPLDDTYANALTTATEGVAETLCGSFARGFERCNAAMEVLRARPVASAWELDTCTVYALRSLAMTGQIKELKRRVDEQMRDAEARGDMYLATNMRIGSMTYAWLADDDATGAQDAADDAMRRWTSIGQVQRLQELLARGDTDLYQCEGKAANLRVEQTWAQLDETQLARVELSVLMLRSLRARSAIAWARDDATRRKTLLDQAARDVNEMARTGAPWGLALASLLRGAIAEVAGDPERALVSYDHARVELDACDLRLYARVAALRAGEIRGGDAGEAQARDARTWMTEQEIVRPDRIASTLAPSR